MVDTERDLNEVWEELKDVIVPQMERVPGVGAVWRFGGRDRQVHVTLDPAAMAARGITVAEVRQAITRENLNVKGGDLSEGKRRHVVRTLGQFQELRHIADVVVRHDVQGPVYVRDVAAVAFGHEDRDFAVRIGGKPALGMGVLRRSGANTMEVMEGVRQTLSRLQKRYGDKGIRLEMVYDETDYIKDSISLVTRNIYLAVALAVLVLLLFLRSAASIVVVGVAIPVSIVTTLRGPQRRRLHAQRHHAGRSGLCHRHGGGQRGGGTGEHLPPPRHGQKRVCAPRWTAPARWAAPSWPRRLPPWPCSSPCCSSNRRPANCSGTSPWPCPWRWPCPWWWLSPWCPCSPPTSFRNGRARGSGACARPCRCWTGAGPGSRGGCWGLLKWLQRGAVRRLAVVLFIVGGSVALAWWFAPPLDYLPRGNRNFIFGLVKMPPGFNTDQKEAIIKEIESRIRAIPEVERMFAVIRVDNPIMGAIVKEPYTDLDGMRRVVSTMRRAVGGIPGTQAVFITQAALFRQRGAFFGGNNVALDVKGDDLQAIRRIARGLEGRIRGVEGVNFVNSSFEWGNPEIRVVLDRDRVSALGLRASRRGRRHRDGGGGHPGRAFSASAARRSTSSSRGRAARWRTPRTWARSCSPADRAGWCSSPTSRRSGRATAPPRWSTWTSTAPSS